MAEAVCEDGTPAVLKLIVPRGGNAAVHEVTVLRLAAGEGCPRLLRDDASRGALLLERLGRSLYELRLPIRRRHEILISAAARIWRPAPDCGLPTGADKARWLAEFIADDVGGTRPARAASAPSSTRWVRDARGDAHRDETAVLVHGDVHQWNALEAGRVASSWSIPTGYSLEPEYDLGIIMREDPLDGDLRERARWLADRTGLDEERDLGVGRCRAGLDRPARDARGTPADRPADARCSRSRSRCPGIGETSSRWSSIAVDSRSRSTSSTAPSTRRWASTERSSASSAGGSGISRRRSPRVGWPSSRTRVSSTVGTRSPRSSTAAWTVAPSAWS